jgi:hypothetical protein
MAWSNWFSNAVTQGPDVATAAPVPSVPSAADVAAEAALPAAAAEAAPYDEQVLQAGWVATERVDGAATEPQQAAAPGDDALQDALAFLARVYSNQGC